MLQTKKLIGGYIPEKFIEQPEDMQIENKNQKKPLDHEIQKAGQEFICRLKRGDLYYIENMADDFLKNNEEFLKSPEVIEAAKEGLISRLKEDYNYFSVSYIIRKYLSEDEEFLKSPEVIEAAKEGLIGGLKMREVAFSRYIMDEFLKEDEEFLKSPEVIEAAKEGLIKDLRNGDFTNIYRLIDVFLKDNEKVVIEAAKQGLIKSIETGYINFAKKIAETFLVDNKEFVIESFRNAVEIELEKNNFTKALKINQFLDKPVNLELARAHEILGDFLDKSSYDMFLEIKQGKIDNKYAELGITAGGEKGFEQLKNSLNKFKGELKQESFAPRKLIDYPFLKQFFKKYIRYDSSSWGNHSESGFLSIIETYQKNKNEKRIKSLNANYTPSEIIFIDKVNKEAQDEFNFSEQFMSRFETVKGSLLDSLKIIKDYEFAIKNENQEKSKESFGESYREKIKPLSAFVNQVDNRLKVLIQDLEDKKAKLNDNPQAINSINNRTKILESLNLRSVKDFQINFKNLAQLKDKEINELLRQFIYFKAFMNHKPERENAKQYLDLEKPDIDGLSWLIDFNQHITNQETMAKYFTDKKAKAAFEELINVKAFEEDFARMQNQETAGTANFQFVPTRGSLLEFSGHISDACWASKYGSIGEQFPNFTACIMVQNPNNQYEKLAGACLLIETKSNRGEPLLVIRGLNPIENTINGLKINDFYEKFTKYAKELAKRAKRKLAIVIDNHSGGSGTNRPSLYSFLDNMRGKLKPVKLASQKDTTFNDYDIKNDCYLVR